MNIFHSNHSIHIALNKIGDLVILNLLFLLCSLPIITIGSSITALYYCTLRIIKGTDDAIPSTFIQAFKDNFKQSTQLFFITLTIYCALIINSLFLYSQKTALSTILLHSSFTLIIFLTIFCIYVFPVIASFSNSLFLLAKNSIIFSIIHLPTTLLLCITTLFPIYFTYLDIALFPLYAFIWFFIGFSFTALLNSFLLYKIFSHYY